MNPVVILSMMTQLVAGLPDLEAAVSGLVSMASGSALTPAQAQAIGNAAAAAHSRVQAIGSTISITGAVTGLPVPPQSPPAP